MVRVSSITKRNKYNEVYFGWENYTDDLRNCQHKRSEVIAGFESGSVKKKLLISNKLSWTRRKQQNVNAGPRKPAIVKNATATVNVAKEKNAPAKANANAAAIVANNFNIRKKLTTNDHKDHQLLTFRIKSIPNHRQKASFIFYHTLCSEPIKKTLLSP